MRINLHFTEKTGNPFRQKNKQKLEHACTLLNKYPAVNQTLPDATTNNKTRNRKYSSEIYVSQAASNRRIREYNSSAIGGQAFLFRLTNRRRFDDEWTRSASYQSFNPPSQ